MAALPGATTPNPMPHPATILAEITLSEAALLKKVREHPFARITVHISDGRPIRVEVGASEMLNELDGRSLSADDLGSL